MCSIQRPLDTRSHLRITLEAEAILDVLARCEKRELDLVASEALDFEVENNPYPPRKSHVTPLELVGELGT